MGFFDFLKPRKRKSAYDMLMENPLFRQQKALFDAMNQVCATGCAGDELPNGHGEFGLTASNPIPTNTIMGSRYYLSQLCTGDGEKVHSERRGHVTSEVSQMPIDVYETSLPDGTRLPTIYISPYQQDNSRKAPRGFSLLFSDTDLPAPSKPSQSKTRAKYQIDTAIEDFHSFLAVVGGRTTERPEYTLVKASWPGLLQFLQPIVTGERLFSAEAMDYAATRLQREQTSITDERATERAIYFGLMSFTVIMFNNHRDRYPRINLDEVAERWLSQAIKPMESLESYGTAIKAAIPKIETLAKHFLIRHVEPSVTDNTKIDDALGWFATQFLSGVVLGQITDFLTLRDYCLEQAKFSEAINDVFGNKQQIPAPDNERYELVRQLILRRTGADSIGGPINELPIDLLLSTADSAVLLIVEQFYMLREQGMTGESAVRTLNEAQATTLSLVGQNLPQIDHPATLFEYVRHFIDSQFAHGEPISDASLRDAIEMVRKYYNR